MTATQRLLRLLQAAPLALSIAAPAFAQAAPPAAPTAAPADETEEIIVTSRKREESVQDVPFAVSAKTGDDLREAGSQNLEDISRIVPSLSVQNLGPGQSQVAVRGISAGQIVRDQPGVKEQVGIYLDESVVSLSLFTPDLDLFDLNRVEVLRGPQGTLFGSGSESGTIRYITNQPNLEEIEANAEGDINFVQDGGRGGDFKGVINMPLIEGKLGLRVAGYWTSFPGFIDAKTPTGKDHDVNEGDRWGFRASLLFQPSDAVSITPRIVYQQVSVDGFAREDRFNILANEYNTSPFTQTVKLGHREQFRQLDEKFTDKFLLTDLNITIQANDWLTITSITSYTNRDILQVRDATQLTGSITGQAGVFDFSDPTPPQSHPGFPGSIYTLDGPLDDSTDVNTVTQELRAAGTHELGLTGLQSLDWVVGYFYSNIDRHYGQSLFVDGFEAAEKAFQTANGFTPFDTEGPLAGTDVLFYSDIPYDFKQDALFGEVTITPIDMLHITGGVRWYTFHENRTLNFDGIFASTTVGVKGETTSDGFNGRGIISVTPNEDIEVSYQIAEGFRLGGINDPLNVPLCSTQDLQTFGGYDTFDDESVLNHELGLKTQWADGRVTANLAGFYTKIRDLQATLDAGTCSSRIVYNVPKAEALGVELELSATPAENLDLSLAANYTNAELKSTVESVPAVGPPVIVGGLKKGRRLPTIPEFQISMASTYTVPAIVRDLDGFVTLTYQHIGSRWTQTGDQDPSFLNPVNLITTVGNPTVSQLSFDPKLAAYDLANLRVGVRNDKWELAFYIDNLGDERAELALDRERGGRARVGFLTNQPRTFGFSGRIAY
jgi:iron complex outermembrane receptor protein